MNHGKYRPPMEKLRELVDRCEARVPSQGRIRPEKTSRGLAAVCLTEPAERLLVAKVVVITPEAISAGTHVANIDRNTYDSSDTAGNYYSCFVDNRQKELGGLAYKWTDAWKRGFSPEEEPKYQEFCTVIQILGAVAANGSAYDSLHQHVSQPGAAANLLTMLGMGVRFHPAVMEAALAMQE